MVVQLLSQAIPGSGGVGELNVGSILVFTVQALSNPRISL